MKCDRAAGPSGKTHPTNPTERARTRETPRATLMAEHTHPDDFAEAVGREFRRICDGKRAAMVIGIEDPSAPHGVRVRMSLMRQDLSDPAAASVEMTGAGWEWLIAAVRSGSQDG